MTTYNWSLLYGHASPCLWKQLLVLSVNLIPCSPSVSFACSCSYNTTFSHYVNSPLSPSITPSLFVPGSRPTSFINLSHHRLHSSLRTDSTDFITNRFFWGPQVFFSFSLLFFRLVPCRRLSWLFVSFLAHVNIHCESKKGCHPIHAYNFVNSS